MSDDRKRRSGVGSAARRKRDPEPPAPDKSAEAPPKREDPRLKLAGFYLPKSDLALLDYLKRVTGRDGSDLMAEALTDLLEKHADELP